MTDTFHPKPIKIAFERDPDEPSLVELAIILREPVEGSGCVVSVFESDDSPVSVNLEWDDVLDENGEESVDPTFIFISDMESLITAYDAWKSANPLT